MSAPTIEALTEREASLVAHIESRVGTMTQKDAELTRDGTTATYGEIESDYLALAAAGDVEALKRALFLAWYSQSEPTSLTGLAGLTSSQVLEAQERTLAIVERGAADPEFIAMLAWYRQVYGWVLGGSAGADRLVVWLATDLPSSEVSLAGVCGRAMEHRGAMGRYFSSISRDPA